MPISKILDEKTRSVIVSDNWAIRRRWMKVSIFWLAINSEAIICWVIYAGGNALGVQIFMTLIGALIAILMFYIFGATWDDHSKRQLLSDAIGASEKANDSDDERPESPPAGDR